MSSAPRARSLATVSSTLSTVNMTLRSPSAFGGAMAVCMSRDGARPTVARLLRSACELEGEPRALIALRLSRASSSGSKGSMLVARPQARALNAAVTALHHHHLGRQRDRDEGKRE